MRGQLGMIKVDDRATRATAEGDERKREGRTEEEEEGRVAVRARHVRTRVRPCMHPTTGTAVREQTDTTRALDIKTIANGSGMKETRGRFGIVHIYRSKEETSKR